MKSGTNDFSFLVSFFLMFTIPSVIRKHWRFHYENGFPEYKAQTTKFSCLKLTGVNLCSYFYVKSNLKLILGILSLLSRHKRPWESEQLLKGLRGSQLRTQLTLLFPHLYSFAWTALRVLQMFIFRCLFPHCSGRPRSRCQPPWSPEVSLCTCLQLPLYLHMVFLSVHTHGISSCRQKSSVQEPV